MSRYKFALAIAYEERRARRQRLAEKPTTQDIVWRWRGDQQAARDRNMTHQLEMLRKLTA